MKVYIVQHYSEEWGWQNEVAGTLKEVNQIKARLLEENEDAKQMGTPVEVYNFPLKKENVFSAIKEIVTMIQGLAGEE